MGMQVPSGLSGLLAELGHQWPATDETGLAALALTWRRFGDDVLPPLVSEAHAHAETIWRTNQNRGIDAIRADWTDPVAPKANLDDAALAASLVAEGLLVAAEVVKDLKANFATQLSALAAADRAAERAARRATDPRLREEIVRRQAEMRVQTQQNLTQLLDIAKAAISGEPAAI